MFHSTVQCGAFWIDHIWANNASHPLDRFITHMHILIGSHIVSLHACAVQIGAGHPPQVGAI